MKAQIRARLALSLLCLTMLVAAMPAQAFRLKYDVAKGDEARYKMLMMGDTKLFVGTRVQETVLTTEMYMTQRVTEVDANTGVITMNTGIDKGTLTVNGIQSPLPYAGQTTQTQMLKNGEIIADGATAGANFNNAQLVFPDKELQIGDSWQTELPPNDQVPAPMTVKYTILGWERYQTPAGRRFRCLKIQSEVGTDPAKTVQQGLRLKVKAEGTILFNLEKGQLVRNAVDSNLEMILKQEIQGKVETLITRMKMTTVLEIQD